MTEERSSAVIPASVTWTLNSLRDPELPVRTFAQRELSLEGEAALASLGLRLGSALKEAGFEWDKLAALFDDGPTDWDLVNEVLGIAVVAAPDIGTAAACIWLGVYETLMDGTANPDFQADIVFIRSAINVTRLIDMVRIYMAQNDYRQALAPFARALGARTGPWSQPSDSDGAPSQDGPRRLYGPDWTPPGAGRTQTEPTTAVES